MKPHSCAFLIFLGLLVSAIACESGKMTSIETHRPQFHFSPDSAWMNDPNGMVFLQGNYHLFYQYYPDSTIWGPMHWGHAISGDLVHWEHKSIALYPDSLGFIFSGSAVVDPRNTSGLGSADHPPLVAIFTYHNPGAERLLSQTQGIAYSLDQGQSWVKYAGNPVLSDPEEVDFRDPKVSWHEASSKWIMTLAVGDHICFYGSENLIDWELLSEFGKEAGAHGGVWECPDLFELEVGNSELKKWVLLVSINPGGPNLGSATQYFVGDFDGSTFTPDNGHMKWIDYGPDDYAGVTWSNTPDPIFLGWMSNWLYANLVPTEKWRSAMTIPRKLQLELIGDEYYIKSQPHEYLAGLGKETFVGESGEVVLENGLGRIDLTRIPEEDFRISFSNSLNEVIEVGYEKDKREFYIDRSHSGKVDFHTEFSNIATAPRISEKEDVDLTLILDHASLELFADGGLTTMTAIFFPHEIMTQVHVELDGSPQVEVTPYH